MSDDRPRERAAQTCRWRTSGETLDLIEAVERIEALLIRLDERLRERFPVERVAEAERSNELDSAMGADGR